MAMFRIGSHGDAVREIQQRLAALQLYRGPIDGAFGGGTEAALKTFQKTTGLEVDGTVGPRTWAKLFDGAEPEPNPLLAEPLQTRCLALTGSFETGAGFPDCFAGLSGDFDGQGLSLGVCQWNFGQKSLQPLLASALAGFRPLLADIFHERLATLEAVLEAPHEEQLAFARSIQHPVQHYVLEPWRGMFKALCRSREFQRVQSEAAGKLFEQAQRLCERFGLPADNQRGLALMFDIVIQNGSISKVVESRIHTDFARIAPELPPAEQQLARMRSIANRRADAANPRWVEDVRARKLCIAEGRGKVHGIQYELAEQFGLRNG